jgi:tetratricopeptide (TPR) repeat protein
LLEHYGPRQKEIFCLAADEIKPLQLKEDFGGGGRLYMVKATFEVATTDFIQAEILNLTLGQQEKKWSYGEEMEQQVDTDVAPAREMSRAYRYIRQKAFRIAIIYLHHLERKYPNWGEVYLAKAIALYAIHSEDEMTAAFERACALGNQEACEDLAGLTKTHE